MSKENVNPGYYKKPKKEKTFKQMMESIKFLDQVYNEDATEEIRTLFNAPGFVASGVNGPIDLHYKDKLPQTYQIGRDGHGRPQIKVQILNNKRLCTHTVYFENFIKHFRTIDQANNLKVYSFSKGPTKPGYNFYIKQYPHYKRVYAGSIIYNDDLLANNVIYAIRELYLIGLTVNSITDIMKRITKYKGLDNLGLTVNLNY